MSQLAREIGCEVSRINVKGKTHEKVDAVGEGRAVEVHAVALLFETSKRPNVQIAGGLTEDMPRAKSMWTF